MKQKAFFIVFERLPLGGKIKFDENNGHKLYERINGSNYYTLGESSFATKATNTLYYRLLELRLSPQIGLCHYECQNSGLINSCLAVV